MKRVFIVKVGNFMISFDLYASGKYYLHHVCLELSDLHVMFRNVEGKQYSMNVCTIYAF
jgi:hypothetical protein